MSSSRKVPHLGSNVSRSNAKIYKFLREAKAELEPTTYSHLLDILSTYESGKLPILRGTLRTS